MGFTKSVILYSKGLSEDVTYNNHLSTGFDWLCHNGIRNVSSELHKSSNALSQSLINEKGFIQVDEANENKGYLLNITMDSAKL